MGQGADLRDGVVCAVDATSTAVTTPASSRRATLAGFEVRKHYKCIASTCTDTWCDANCNHVPKYCPASFCREETAPVTYTQSCSSSTDLESASTLNFTTSPSASTGGASFPTQPVVTVTDKDGNTVTTSNLTITLTVASGCGVLSGVTSVRAVAGVATFSGLSVDSAGEYVLAASATLSTLDATIISVQSSSFIVSAGAATGLSFEAIPSNTVAGAVFATQPVVVITDAGGNVDTSSTASVTVSIASGSGSLAGTTTVAAVSGVANFSGLSIDTAGQYTLSASTAGTDALTSASPSGSFAVSSAGTPMISAFPCNNATLQQPLQVIAVDAEGNAATASDTAAFDLKVTDCATHECAALTRCCFGRC